MSSSRREARFFNDEVFPVLKFSDLEQLELHVGRIVLGVHHIQGLVTVDPIEKRAGEDLHTVRDKNDKLEDIERTVWRKW